MKKTNSLTKRLLAVCLALTTVLSLLALTAGAEDAGSDDFKLLFEFEDEGPWSGTCDIIGYEGTVPQDLVIPEEEQGYWVNGIGQGAFANCDTLRSVSGGDLTYIGLGAFADCDNLETVSLGGDFYDAQIGDYAFQNCKKLKSFAWTAGTMYFYINDGAFFGCSALTEVTWFVPMVAQDAFFGCYSLKTVHLDGYKPDFEYDYPRNMVDETGNRSYLFAQWDWMHYPEQVASSRVELNLSVGETYVYTLKTPVKAGQSMEYRYVDQGSIWVEVYTEDQAPGTVTLHTEQGSEGWKEIVFLILDENGDVLHEEYVTIHTEFTPKQKLQNEWNALRDLLLGLFRKTFLYRIIRVLFARLASTCAA